MKKQALILLLTHIALNASEIYDEIHTPGARSQSSRTNTLFHNCTLAVVPQTDHSFTSKLKSSAEDHLIHILLTAGTSVALYLAKEAYNRAFSDKEEQEIKKLGATLQEGEVMKLIITKLQEIRKVEPILDQLIAQEQDEEALQALNQKKKQLQDLYKKLLGLPTLEHASILHNDAEELAGEPVR